MNKVRRWVFRYVGNKTFDFSSKKKDFLPINDQIWHKTGIFGQFGPGHAGLFNAMLWVGWELWRVGCISQDTYLLYGSEPEEGLLDDERQSWPLRRFFLWFSIRPLIPPSILLKFSFSTEECL